MQNFLSRWYRVFAVGIGALLFAAGVHAQNPTEVPTLAGTVLDQAGKAIPNATVTIKNEAGATVRTATTDGQGHFSETLAAGTYTLEVSASGFATTSRTGQRVATGAAEELSITLGVSSVSQTVTVSEVASVAAQLAPLQASLDEFSPHSDISEPYIKNFTSPVSDFTDVLQMAPGTFSVSPNGVGLGQPNTYYRGFPDGDYTITYDGIPFEDTNTPSHHSWAFFPAPFLGGVDFDRSPGFASTVGPENFGGSINLLSRDLPQDMNVRATMSYGSWDTRLLGLDFDSGLLADNKSNFTVNVNQIESSGYQTGNKEKRDGGLFKYQYKVSEKTTLTMLFTDIDLWSNAPNIGGPTRAQVAQYGYNYLLNGDPTSPTYFGYNHYHVQTDFGYLGVHSELGSGWKFDNKFYQYRYWNNEAYNSATKISATSAVDKMNGYNKFGDIIQLSHDDSHGTFRTGMWYEWAYTDRYQYPSDPLTGVDSVLPNFHEHFTTQSLQPFAEYELKVTRKLSMTGGIKLAYYNMDLNQYADNGGKIGNPGVQFVTHDAGYSSWLPFLAARYKIKNNWSAYAQYGAGSIIPPSAVFDVANGAVLTLPKPTLANTYQVGSVWKINRVSLDADAYYIHFQNTYSSTPDQAEQGEAVYYLGPDSITKGLEGEANVFIAKGISFYVNGTMGNAKYVGTGLWVQDAPRNTEAYGLTYQNKGWAAGIFDKRVGAMYNDNGSTHNAVFIDPFSMTNLYINYTIKDLYHLNQTKIGLSFNNLFDNHNIVGVTPASASTSIAAPGDVLTILPGRSVMVTLTVGYSPKKPSS
jgi:iron complex outermembrane recepter protein